MNPANPTCFQVPEKSHDPRLAHVVSQVSPQKLASSPPGWALIGYPDSEGVKRNKGRPGAEQAPDAIRTALYKLCSHKEHPALYDLGNIPVEGSLEDRHARAQDVLFKALKNHKVLALGGGHDYGFPDGSAFLRHCNGENSARPLIVNVDAHLDVREAKSERNSGTPFYQLLEEYKDFDLIQFGYQRQANSSYHEVYARSKNVTMIPYEARAEAVKLIGPHCQTRRPLFISLDMDGFSSMIAPGVSAAWPLGLLWPDVEPVLRHLIRRHDLKMVGVYEVSPPLDVQNITVRLAASIFYQILDML